MNSLFNEYKMAVKRRKTIMTVHYSKSAIVFAKFLIKRGLLNGVCIKQQQTKKVITFFIKYDKSRKSSISDFSVMSKTKMKNNKEQQNFIMNFTQKQGSFFRLLARVR
jgi:ribosomal protein S8